MQKPLFYLTTIAAAFATTGCVSPQISAPAKEQIDNARVITDFAIERMKPASKAAYERSEEVDAPWIVGKSVPLARALTLPAALRKDVKTRVIFPDPWVSLTDAAERVMLASGIIVTIAPDVYLDPSVLQRKSVKDTGSASNNANGGAQPGYAAMPVGMPVVSNPIPLPIPAGYGKASPNVPVATGGAAKGQHPPESPAGFDLPSMEAPLSQILDIIGTKLGIKWRYDDSTNSIRFYRLVTKTWETPFRAAKSSYKSTLQGETANSNNANALTSRTPANSPVDETQSDLVELTAMRDHVDSVLTRAGNVYANAATGAITATDTTEAIEAADDIIKNGIRSVSRAVRLRVQTIKVTSNQNAESGVDLSLAVSRALKNLPDFTSTLSSAASLASTTGGSVGLHVFSGSMSGSTALIKALKDIGDVAVSTEIPLNTRNRKGVYYNVRKTFSYVSATTPAAATTGGTGGTPGITTAQDQVGLKLMMYPEATSRDTIMLTMSLDQSTLTSLDTFSSGSGMNMQAVQLPNIEGEGSSQEVPIQNGRTIVLTGFDTQTNEYDKRTLGENVPALFGGSLRSTHNRSTTLVLVTAEVIDGQPN